jgi:uncharacterized membrane protein YgdD (TMEM256/DUF423 family)
MITAKSILIVGALSNALCVGLGAFGAHALKDLLEKNGYLKTYETAVQYHFVHSLALLLVGILVLKFEMHPYFRWSGALFMAGIILFSGSLYALSISGIKILGAITPFGGLSFILGWIFLALALGKIV